MTHSHATLAPALELLASRSGNYEGRGRNVEGHEFSAALELTPKVDGALVEIKFLAKDADAGFHEELTWITPDLKSDRLCLWTVSTNTPGVLCHALTADDSDDVRERRFVFRLGDPEQRSTFRQEIVLALMRDGGLDYRYSWGIPHEDFGIRVQAQLRKRT